MNVEDVVWRVVEILRSKSSQAAKRAELRQHLNSLSIRMQYALGLIMYTGRGDIRASQWRDGHKGVRRQFAKPEWLVSQMVGKLPRLADYLERGLFRYQASGLCVNALMEPEVTKRNVRSVARSAD